jgi:type IV pilus assembly protein PilA
VFCSSCGNDIAENVAFCAKCGARAGSQVAPAERLRRNPLVIALLVVMACLPLIGFMIGGVALPKWQGAVRQAAEVSAVQQLHSIQAAQTQYFLQFSRYATSLAEVGQLIPTDLASGVKGGYRLALESSPNRYRLHVLPIPYGETGVRSFYTDESLVVHQNVGPAGHRGGPGAPLRFHD